MSKPIDATSENFEQEALKADGLVLVDFWAPWCSPCKAIAPLLDKVAAEKAGTVKVVKVNIDDENGIAAKYNVRALPTLMAFRGGHFAGQKTGALSGKDLDAFLASV